jgi:hypothetical protein
VYPVPSEIRGFNYSGSWGTSGLDLWQHHDQAAMAAEVQKGKSYFPGWNVVRWWLSHEAFRRRPDKFLMNFGAGLELFSQHDIQVMPVLFNRWRDPDCDFGGVGLDHLVPEASFWCRSNDFITPSAAGAERSDDRSRVERAFADYIDAVVGTHAKDARIHSWDMCNEPFFGPHLQDPESEAHRAEIKWLTWCRARCEAAGASQPLTIGNIADLAAIELTEPLCDYLSFHPYYIPRGGPAALPHLGTRESFEQFVDDTGAFAARCNKELVANETVWGSLDNTEREELIRYTLGVLTQRNIGFVAHALHHSLVADLHAAAFGPVGPPGRLEFIEADGSLRMGHGVFNEFAR